MPQLSYKMEFSPEEEAADQLLLLTSVWIHHWTFLACEKCVGIPACSAWCSSYTLAKVVQYDSVNGAKETLTMKDFECSSALFFTYYFIASQTLLLSWQAS